MEDRIEQPYQDSPTPSPVSSRSSTPSPSSNPSTAKPLPLLPVEAVPQPTESYNHQPIEPYRDDPSDIEATPVIASPAPQRNRPALSVPTVPPPYNHPPSRPNNQVQIDIVFPPYTDADPENDDDVPLAHLYPYPTEAPPSYQHAVRESYRATLVQHIPNISVSTQLDEEAGVERSQADDVRFTVERVMAAIIVSMILLVLTTLLAIIALSSTAIIKW